ncbi:hypothetical protein ES702_04375 [subsurface metagenome]
MKSRDVFHCLSRPVFLLGYHFQSYAQRNALAVAIVSLEHPGHSSSGQTHGPHGISMDGKSTTKFDLITRARDGGRSNCPFFDQDIEGG